METSKKKAARAKLPIYDDMLVAISTKAILASGRFLHTTDAWEEKNDTYKKWSEWKEIYLVRSQHAIECSISWLSEGGNHAGYSLLALNWSQSDVTKECSVMFTVWDDVNNQEGIWSGHSPISTLHRENRERQQGANSYTLKGKSTLILTWFE